MMRLSTETEPLNIVLVPVETGNLHDVHAVFRELQAFSERVDGVSIRHDAARAFMTSLPPDHDPRKKHAFVAKTGGQSIGLLDMVADYPSPGTVFIGLLAVRESVHGVGFGKAIWRAAEDFARQHLKAEMLRLAVVEGNPVLGFWTKMGFTPTGEESPYRGERSVSRATLMQKSLVRPEG